MSKEQLEVGQKVWVETLQMFWRTDERERTVTEYEITEVNKTSAYAVGIDKLEEYRSDDKKNSFMRKRIEQRTHKIKGGGFGDVYQLWLTKESFEEDIEYIKELTSARKEAHEVVGALSLDELKGLIERFK